MTLQASVNDELLKIKEAAELLDIHPQTLRNWEKKGYIKPQKTLKGHRRYKRSELQAFLLPNVATQAQINIVQQELEVTEVSEVTGLDDGLNPEMFIQDYDDQYLIPVKSQVKALEHMISNYQHRQGLLLLIASMLLVIVIRILYIVNASTNLIVMATEFHQNYTEYMSSIDKQEKQYGSDSSDNSDSSDRLELKNTGHVIPVIKKKDTVWQKAKKQASKVFLSFSKASVDQSLDEEERNRAKYVINKILGPYQRATSNLSEYEPGIVDHDVAALLLFHQPSDFKINRDRWSVRLLSKVCKTNLGTTACSRSQVHRVLQQLKWNCATRPKMMSPDENYGKIMKRLGLLFCDLSENDLVLFGDEFLYSTVKVAEYKKPKTAPEGLNSSPPFSLSKPYYRSVASILVSGLMDPRSKRLIVEEMETKDYETFFEALCVMVDQFRTTIDLIDPIDGDAKIHIILDNARYHCPEILHKQLTEKYNGMVTTTFLPSYSPHHNPIERVWQFLLRNSLRCGEDEKELWSELQGAVGKYHETGDGTRRPLQLHCDICGHKWIFQVGEDQDLNKQSLEKHICFQIEWINPFNIHVLKHSVEPLGSESLAYPFTK